MLFAKEVVIQPEEEERIMRLSLTSGEVLSENQIAYKNASGWYISLLDFMESLGFEVEMSSTRQELRGKTEAPRLNVLFDAKNCNITKKLDDEETSFKEDCGKMFFLGEELVIHEDLLSKVLELKFEMDSLKSKMIFSTSVPYPVIQSIRRSQTKIKGLEFKELKESFPILDGDSSSLSNIFLDQKLQPYWSSQLDPEVGLEYSTSASTEVLGTEVYLQGEGRTSENSYARMRAEKHFYGASDNAWIRSLRVGDISMNQVDMIGGSNFGKGISISNYGFDESSTYSFTVIEGDLEQGWEVELYLNQSLIDRKQATLNGRYRFENLPLIYGQNKYLLKFYGPQGQSRTEYKTINVGQGMLRKGETKYFINGAEVKGHFDSSAQIETHLFKNLSAQMGFSRAPLGVLEEERHSYSLLGVRSYFGSLSGAFRYANQLDAGDAFGWQMQFPLGISNWSAEHYAMSEFQSPVLNTSGTPANGQTRLNVALPLFGRINALYRFNQKTYQSQKAQNDLLQVLSLTSGKFSWTFQNELITRDENSIALRYNSYNWSLRPTLNYSFQDVTSAAFQVQWDSGKGTRIQTRANYDFNTYKPLYGLGTNTSLSKVNLIFNAQTDGDKEHEIRCGFSFSLDWSLKRKELHWNKDPIAEKGNADMEVFIDENGNGRKDEKDSAYENARIQWLQGRKDYSTLSNGLISVYELPVFRDVEVKVSPASIQDPNLRPKEKGYRLLLQPGQKNHFKIPLERIYELEGQVISQKDYIPRIRFELFDVESDKKVENANLDRDGYFLFQNLKRGKYVLKPNSQQVRELRLKLQPDSYTVDTNNPDDLDQSFVFTLR
tara:strand:- start:651 stop:3152 length:2502 start_codon:yes stop_codon:yes gene_type:complete